MATRQEVNAVITRVLGLPDLAKFKVFDALLKDLGEQVGEEASTVRLVRERKEAVKVIGLVAEHLELAANKAPTVKQFDEVVGEVAEEWSSQKVIRVWERWRLAIQSYKGERRTDPPERRQMRRKNAAGSHGKRSRDDYVQGVRTWLATKPKKETKASYDSFAEQHNAERAALPYDFERRRAGHSLVQAISVTNNLSIGWPYVLKVAKEEISLAKAQEAQLADSLPPVSENRIIGLASIAKLLKRQPDAVKELANTEPSFPVSVAHIQEHRAWLYEDMLLYKRGLAAPERDEDELQSLFADADELQARLVITPTAFKSALRRKRWDLIPKPEGALVGGIYYWKRTQIDHWLKGASKTQAMASSLKGRFGNKFLP
jgi:hypothetical protein